MKLNTKLISTLVIMVGTLMYLAGCAAAGSPPPKPCSDQPGWVNQGGGFFSGDRGSAIYGVGVADIAGNAKMSILRIASDTRARADVAQTIMNNIEVMTKSYSGYVSAEDKANYEELVRQGIISFTKINLTGAAIVDHYNCPDEKAYYALARMDAESFVDTFKKMNQVSDEVKSLIEQHSQEVFDEMGRRGKQTP